MPFDPLIVNTGRLRILTALVAEDRQEFVRLRKATALTDGNLSAHARRLQAAGLIEIEKQFREGKPVTTIHLTDAGRRRLTAHVRALVAFVGRPGPEEPVLAAARETASAIEEDWVD